MYQNYSLCLIYLTVPHSVQFKKNSLQFDICLPEMISNHITLTPLPPYSANSFPLRLEKKGGGRGGVCGLSLFPTERGEERVEAEGGEVKEVDLNTE